MIHNLSSLKKRILHLLFNPMDASGLAVVRMLYGLIIVYESWHFIDFSRFSGTYFEQIFYFKFRFFEWIEPLGAVGMNWLYLAYGVSGFLIFLGLFYRLAATCAFLCISYIFLLDMTNYLNHFYLLIIFSGMMIFIPAQSCWSIHAWIRPNEANNYVSGWSIWLIRTQLLIVYFYAAIAKMNVDWINGMPLFEWLGDHAAESRGFESYLGHPISVYAFTYLGLLYDLTVAPMLLYKRTRALAYCLTISFHLTNSYLFNIGIFPWFMLATSTIFFDPDWPRNFLNFFWPQKFRPIKLPNINLNNIELKPIQNIGFFVAALHLSFQAAFPLRHFLYSDYVAWTEEGHNFSWHMKLRDKYGSVNFVVVDPDTRRSQAIRLENFLTERQIDKMPTRPFMLLQFAHFLSDHYTGPNESPAEVYANTWLSLNGREPQRIIDPKVNLAAISAKEFGNTWVLPIRQPLWNASNKKNRFGPAFKDDEMAKRAILSPSYTQKIPLPAKEP